MLTLTARQWLELADWNVNDQAQREALVIRIGQDKTDEFIAMVDRLATNLLYTLDGVKMSEKTMMEFNRVIAGIALDNVVPHDRGIE
jgi:hypothetical protein